MLRPEFTRLLAERLLRGDNINLQGEHGLGRRQTVNELCSLIPEEISVSRLDIRRDKVDPEQWLSKSIRLPGRKLLILHNFDELNFEKESTRSFTEQLTIAGKRDDIALLMVTVSLPAAWEADIDSLPLPPLP